MEAAESAVLQALLPPGGTFVDVGANWGYFSLLAATLLGLNRDQIRYRIEKFELEKPRH